MEVFSINQKVAQPPGTSIYVGSKGNAELSIDLIEYNKDDYSQKKLTPEQALNLEKSANIRWVNINGLNNIQFITSICEKAELHGLQIEEIVNTMQRPKTEENLGSILSIVKMLYYDEDVLMNEHVSLLLYNNTVYTFQEIEGDVFNPIRDRLKNQKGRIRIKGGDYLFYALLDLVVDHYFIVMEKLGDKIELLEEEIIEKSDKLTSFKIQALKREILQVRKSIFPLREVISKLEKSESKFIKSDTKKYLRDLYDHAIQVIENIENYRDISFGLMDMYTTNISTKMNTIMQTLTIVSTIFIPLTFIAGIYGMNFEYIPELKWKYSYFVLWGMLFLIFIGMLGFFRRKKWL